MTRRRTGSTALAFVGLGLMYVACLNPRPDDLPGNESPAFEDDSPPVPAAPESGEPPATDPDLNGGLDLGQDPSPPRDAADAGASPDAADDPE